MTVSPAADTVRRRLVYYLAGFDTRSARFYHELYRAEAAQQQAINRCEYVVGDLTPDGPLSTHWDIHARCGSDRVETRYTFLQWNDIVRAHWPRSSTRVAMSIPAFYRRFAANGGVTRTWQLSRPFFWMLMLPLLYGCFFVMAAVLAWFGVDGLASRAGWSGLAASLAGLSAAVATIALGVVASERQRVFWLMRAWTFLLLWGRKGPEPLQERWDEFAAKIDHDLKDGPVDEVLIIGHSAGAMAAIAVAARWLARGDPGRGRSEKIKLVTLGNATPMLGVIPEAEWFRGQIADVGASTIPWIDYTAPADALCYALVNPFTACGLEPPQRRTYRVKSARFDRMFNPETYAKVRRDYFRIHFQYLMSTCGPVDNDYFQLTAGPRPLVVDASAQ